MSFKQNDKIKNITPYKPDTESYSVILNANESFQGIDSNIMEEILGEIKSLKLNRYPDPLASELCKSFAKLYDIDPKLVTASNGSDEMIGVIINSFLQKGDKVLTFEPDFSMYSFYATFPEAEVVKVKKNKDFSINVKSVIETANTENVRLIIFSNPCNPTSVGETRDTVRKILKNTNALVVLDEAYMDFWDQSLLSEIDEYDNLIILRTASKAIGMAGVRLGFAVANKEITEILRKVKSPYNINSISQLIGTLVLREKSEIERATCRLIVSRENLYTGLSELSKKYPEKIDLIVSNTNFVYAKFDHANLLYKKLQDSGIIVRQFGDYLRITGGRNHENSAVLNVIDNFYKES